MTVGSLCLTVGCSAKDQTAQNPPVSSAPPARTVPAASEVEHAPPPDVAAPTWNDIKNNTYSMSAAFVAGLSMIEKKFDDQITGFNAQRAAVAGDARDSEIAMMELKNARASLRSAAVAVAAATDKTWNDERDKVGRAIQRVQDACDKVKTSTTS